MESRNSESVYTRTKDLGKAPQEVADSQTLRRKEAKEEIRKGDALLTEIEKLGLTQSEGDQLPDELTQSVLTYWRKWVPEDKQELPESLEQRSVVELIFEAQGGIQKAYSDVYSNRTDNSRGTSFDENEKNYTPRPDDESQAPTEPEAIDYIPQHLRDLGYH